MSTDRTPTYSAGPEDALAEALREAHGVIDEHLNHLYQVDVRVTRTAKRIRTALRRYDDQGAMALPLLDAQRDELDTLHGMMVRIGNVVDRYRHEVGAELRAAPEPVERGPAVDPVRLAQMIAHRACHSAEHDPENGKLHGCCVVCGQSWPCAYAGPAPEPQEGS